MIEPYNVLNDLGRKTVAFIHRCRSLHPPIVTQTSLSCQYHPESSHVSNCHGSTKRRSSWPLWVSSSLSTVYHPTGWFRPEAAVQVGWVAHGRESGTQEGRPGICVGEDSGRQALVSITRRTSLWKASPYRDRKAVGTSVPIAEIPKCGKPHLFSVEVELIGPSHTTE